ncbi:MAG: CDP-alcohol phosphatidyltransferase family protein [Gemmatimonadales bacterium]
MKRLRAVLEKGLRATVEPAVSWLTNRRVLPNILSTAGFLITCSSGFFFHQHHVRTAGFLILLGGVFDIFDGTVARRTGLASPFGAFYDSTLDRLSEIIVYVGLLSLYNDYRLELGDVGMIYWIFLAMAGSLMISYTRARAEGLGVRCDVGMMQRAERVILIGFAALIFGEATLLGVEGLALRVVIIGLAILTNITVVQRIVWVYQHSRPYGRPEPEAAVRPPADESHFAGPPDA